MVGPLFWNTHTETGKTLYALPPFYREGGGGGGGEKAESQGVSLCLKRFFLNGYFQGKQITSH